MVGGAAHTLQDAQEVKHTVRRRKRRRSHSVQCMAAEALARGRPESLWPELPGPLHVAVQSPSLQGSRPQCGGGDSVSERRTCAMLASRVWKRAE